MQGAGLVAHHADHLMRGVAPNRTRRRRPCCTALPACNPSQPSQHAPSDEDQAQGHAIQVTRRGLGILVTTACLQPALGLGEAAASDIEADGPAVASPAACRAEYIDYLQRPLDILGPGPCRVANLPKIEVLCTSCFSSCAGTNCLLKVTVLYPKGGVALGLRPPYPLAIFSSGFLLSSDSYRSSAERLASWGYTVLLYDKVENISDSLDDVTSVKAIRFLIGWAGRHKLVKRLADTSRVYLVGHSRGGKLSVLAGVLDSRVKAVCLLDPVDNTVYAPLSPTFPSAVAALRQGRVGTGPAADNTQSDSNESATQAGGGDTPYQPAVSVIQTPSSIYASTAQLPFDKDDDDDGGGRLTSGPQPQLSALPLAVIGSGQGGGCAPPDANYSQFFDAAPGAAWEVVVQGAGHFEYLDDASPLQRVVCPGGTANSSLVRSTAQLVMVAWAEMMVRGRGSVLLLGEQAFPEACQGLLPSNEPGGSRRLQGSLRWSNSSSGVETGQPVQGRAGQLSAVGTQQDGSPRVADGGISSSGGGDGDEVLDAQAELESLVTQLRYLASSQREEVQVTTRYKRLTAAVPPAS